MSDGDKDRLDYALVARGITDSRSRAQALIKGGFVQVDGIKQDKPSAKVCANTILTLTGIDHPWVSRGGMKLAGALEAFTFNPAGMMAADIGASTGGFTDVLLHHGARRVYAVDVGTDQLAHKLREDWRVEVLEQTNARTLDQTLIPDPLDLVVCDASFISLKTVLPAALDLVRVGGAVIALIKPQFEVGKGRVGKGGIVKDPALHEEVCADITAWLNEQAGWAVQAVCPSPIMGPDGNVEFLIYALKNEGVADAS